MLKPFAISPREQLAIVNFILNSPSETKEERAKRKACWAEIGMKETVRKILKVQKPKAAGTPPPDPLNDPDGVYAWQFSEEEPTVRCALYQATVTWLIEKLSGRMEGPVGEVLGELCDRLISLRDTAEAVTITRDVGGGYKLPRALWSPDELSPPPAAG